MGRRRESRGGHHPSPTPACLPSEVTLPGLRYLLEPGLVHKQKRSQPFPSAPARGPRNVWLEPPLRTPLPAAKRPDARSPAPALPAGLCGAASRGTETLRPDCEGLKATDRPSSSRARSLAKSEINILQ